MAPSNGFQAPYHDPHDSDEDHGFSEYEKELFLDEEEQSLRRGSRPQRDDRQSLSQNSNNTYISSDEEIDPPPTDSQQVDESIIVISGAPEFLAIPPKMNIPKKATFPNLPPQKTSKSKPQLIEQISTARASYSDLFESHEKLVHGFNDLRGSKT
jgi:hypothetical protein